jgi:two-component sensor histidine kinase
MITSALAEKEALIQEIPRRVKNNLTAIISLIHLQISSFDPAYLSL